MDKIRSFDIFGNIAIAKFPRDFKLVDKKKFANNILEDNNSIKTVLEKVGKFSGRLRKMKTKHIAGEKTKEVLYKENKCVFRFNIDTTYFSSRLSNERKEIASKIKKGDKVLVMFAGVAPFSIVIARNSKAKKVVSNEINREANKYAKLNIELNKVKNKVELASGDIKKVIEKMCGGDMQFSSEAKKKIALSSSRKEREENKGCPRFDVIVMPRPQLKDTFLQQAFKVSKKNTKIFYYDFCGENEVDAIIEKIQTEAKKAKKKIKILKTKSAGEIAPYKIRVRVDFEVL
jgi:tRNA (guanine37-N1)-methyltransferase